MYNRCNNNNVVDNFHLRDKNYADLQLMGNERKYKRTVHMKPH